MHQQTAQINTSEVSTFDFEGFGLRALLLNGEPWFVASDVCEALALNNVSQACSRLDDDERTDITTNDVTGRLQATVCINESGLYSLILTSRKPEAKRFKKWVTAEVLPSIRKTGGYGTQNSHPIPATYAQALMLAAQQAEKLEQQQALIAHQKPAVEFLERYVEARSTKSLREVAKVLGIKERQFITMLEESEILFRQSGSLIPFAHYQHAGYFEVKTGEANGHAFHQTRFTPDGIAWIAKRVAGKKVA